jgi:hypothetical protein
MHGNYSDIGLPIMDWNASHVLTGLLAVMLIVAVAAIRGYI